MIVVGLILHAPMENSCNEPIRCQPWSLGREGSLSDVIARPSAPLMEAFSSRSMVRLGRCCAESSSSSRWGCSAVCLTLSLALRQDLRCLSDREQHWVHEFEVSRFSGSEQ